MKTIFDQTNRDEIINRIHALDKKSEARWGKMNINQMIRHCIYWEEVALGKRKVKRTLLSKLLGKLFLKGFIKDDSPLKHHLPAVDELKMKKNIKSDISSEKEKWISLIQEYPNVSQSTLEIPFFGPVKKEEAGLMAYKHSDHHLRQFGG